MLLKMDWTEQHNTLEANQQ